MYIRSYILVLDLFNGEKGTKLRPIGESKYKFYNFEVTTAFEVL